ncbi:MAG: DUF5615 family PIN-like protein [Chloroflexi bacterium]|nr:DUF5615 family PIN-like protein [Chloroflexota bacterium]
MRNGRVWDFNENLSERRGLRLRNIDVLTAQDAHMLGASDEEHLKLATHLNRVVFTNDDDFLKLQAAGFEHAGIAFAHQRTSIGRVSAGANTDS